MAPTGPTTGTGDYTVKPTDGRDPITIHRMKRRLDTKEEPKKLVDQDMRAYERELWKERRRRGGDR